MAEPISTAGHKLIWRDVAEIVIGSCVLAFPVSVTEEVWNLSKTLPVGRVLYMAIWSRVGEEVFQAAIWHQRQGITRDGVQGVRFIKGNRPFSGGLGLG